jgi:DNA-binding SARP family transcriptional activator/class 3 adenylate cyclase/tetratricopeptide (TPR) repeat protein
MTRSENATADLQLLGQFRLVLGRKPNQALAVNAPRHRALLGYLALHPEGVGRDQVAELLWGDSPDRQARQSLRQAILSIRKHLKPSNTDLLEAERDFLRLGPSSVRVDVQEFLHHANSNSPFSLSLATDLYKGELFGSFVLGLETFDSWLESARARLRLKAAELFEHQISYLNSEGHYAEALVAAERLVGLDTANEASQRLLIRQIAAHRGRNAAIEHASIFAEHVKSHYGAKLEAETLQLIGSLRKPSSQRFAPEAFPRLLTSQTALEGERKLITVLLASMNMTMGGDPEEEWRRLNPVIKHLSAAVRTYGGIVNQITHNGIMALFGAPEAREDHAISACSAALRMLEARAASEEQAGGEVAQIRVAISSGEVIIRAVANDLQVDYSAIGETTQIAKRLEQLTPAGKILISRSTNNLASGFVKVRPFAISDALGASMPTEIYELRGAVANGSRLLGAAARGLTPFVGRAAELEQFRQALQRARRGRGGMIAVTGEPGVGKSRICAEFLSSGMTVDFLVLQGRAASFGPARSLLPFIEMLRAYFRIRDSDDVAAMRLKVRNGVMALGDNLASLLPSLLSILDIPVDNAAWQQSSPANRRRQTLEDIGQFLLRLGRKRCLVIMIENLHRIDSESDLLLDRLIEESAGHRIILLLSYRPEYTNRWLGPPHCREIRLEPLDEDSAGEFVTHLLGEHPSLMPLVQALLKRTDGNPLFLEESVRLLIEIGLLAGKRGAFHARQNASDIDLPETVQGLLADRIDRLSSTHKRLLQTAAVVGRRVKASLLADVADISPVELQEGLMRLESADLLRPLASPEPTYIFKHGFTHEVAYRGILRNRRRDLHARIASAMEARYTERLDEHAEQLGYHAFKGELWAQAVDYLHLAGINAASRSQNRDAKVLLEMAIAALERLPKTRVNSERSIDIRLELRTALLSMADQAAAERICVEARDIAADLADSARLGRIMANLSTLYMTKGDLKGGLAFGAQAVAQGDVGNKALGLPAMASNMQSLGRHEEAITWFRETIAFASGPLLYERFGQLLAPSVFGHAGLAIGLAETGQFEEAIEAGKRGVQIAEARQLPASNLAYALAGLGRAFLRQGNIGEAKWALERGAGICRDFDIPYYEVVLTPLLASTYVLAEKSRLAVELLERIKQVGERMNMRNMYPLIIGALSEALLETGNPDRANALANEALDVIRAQYQRGFEAETLKLSADIARRSPDPVLAERRYNEALLVATECGMLPLAAHCHFGLGELYRKTGGPSGDHLHRAFDFYKGMGMTWWLKKAQASLNEAGSRTNIS